MHINHEADKVMRCGIYPAECTASKISSQNSLDKVTTIGSGVSTVIHNGKASMWRTDIMPAMTSTASEYAF